MLRIKNVKSSIPLLAGSTALSDKDAEMLLEGERLYVRRRNAKKLPAGSPLIFVIPLDRLDRVEPFEGQLEDIFEGDPEPVTADSVAQAVADAAAYVRDEAKTAAKPAPPPPPPEPVKDDEERAIKINGKVEFRRGPMKPDEIAARVQAKKDRVESLLQISEVEWTPEQRKLVEEYTATNPPDAVPTPPAAPARPTIAAMVASKTAE